MREITLDYKIAALFEEVRNTKPEGMKVFTEEQVLFLLKHLESNVRDLANVE